MGYLSLVWKYAVVKKWIVENISCWEWIKERKKTTLRAQVKLNINSKQHRKTKWTARDLKKADDTMADMVKTVKTPFRLMWFKPRFSSVLRILMSAEDCGCLTEGRGRFTFWLWSIRFLHGLRSLRYYNRREPRLEPHKCEKGIRRTGSNIANKISRFPPFMTDRPEYGWKLLSLTPVARHLWSAEWCGSSSQHNQLLSFV